MLVVDYVEDLLALNFSDPEMCHDEADEILLKALRHYGGNEGASIAQTYEDIRDKVGFGYA